MSVDKIGQIFMCEKCGNEVIVTKKGGGTLSCCSVPMKLVQEENVELFDEEDEESEE
ncbi:MAG: desulforedoxin [bacterium]